MCVLKGNAYGHGAVPVARHLEKNGFSYFTVATSLEGEELRQGGVKGYIQILGTVTYSPSSIYSYKPWALRFACPKSTFFIVIKVWIVKSKF